MKSIITAAVLFATTSLPLSALATEEAFDSMYKAKYDQLMAMPYIKKVAECLGGWTVINSTDVLFKHAAWHTEKFTNMIIEDGSISSVEVQHRMRAMQDFSKYLPDGINDTEIARIKQRYQFGKLMINQCAFDPDTGKLWEKSYER